MATIVGEVQLNNYCKYQIGYNLVSQDITKNTSTIIVYGFLVVTGSYVSWSSGTAEVWGNIDILDTYYSQGTYTVVAKELGVVHDNNGNYSNYLTGSITTNYLSGSTSGLMTLPKINRIGQVISANDFTDEENPKMTIANNGGYVINVRLEVRDKDNVLHTIHQVNNVQTIGEFEFELTTAERNELREYCVGQAFNVRYVVATCVNSQSETDWNWLDRTMTIVNASPTFTYSELETNQKVINMLGSSSANILIKNASELEVTMVPTAYKYATIDNVYLTSGRYRDTIRVSPYVFNIPAQEFSGRYIYTITDSRGFAVGDVIEKNTIDYIAVKINNYSFKRESPISSNIIFNGEFTYWGNSVGSYTNTPVVKWKLDDGSWNTIPSSNYSIDITNHKLTITNYQISNILNYQNKGQFSILIEDSLTSASDTSENGLVLKGVPTFEAGEYDFQVNGDLIIANTNRENPINVRDALSSAGAYNIITNGSEVKLPYKIDNKDAYMKRLSVTKYTGTSLIINTGVSSFTRMWIDAGQSYVRNTANNIFIALFQYGDPNDWVRAYQLGGNITVLFGNTYNTVNAEVVVTIIYQKT